MIVSSPGIERKLKSLRHFELSIGELVKIKLINPIDDVYTFEGTLASVDDKTINLKIEDDESEIKISDIKNAKIEFKQFKEKVKG
jgi:ribosome maturation factor RimP